MRKLVTNKQDDFRVKAYAGTNGVLLAFDLDESRKRNFLGFAIERKTGKKPWQWLLNSLTFPETEHTLPKWNATPTNIAPIQKFRWADYNVEPGTLCQYRIHLVYKDEPALGEMLEVSIKTDDGIPNDHEVIFNRAVAASQAFERNFPELNQLLSEDKTLSVEEWPEAPRKWLENGLLKGVVDFIARAKDGKWALDVAIYEYELPSIVAAINDAHQRGVDVRVIYHAKKNDKQTEQNETSLKKIPVKKKRGRITSKIFHHKFIVLSKINTAGKRVPQAVLCGSTNFTENGVYRQANVVHKTNDKSIAVKYLTLFDLIWDKPDDVAFIRNWITDNNSIDSTANIFAGFSPRTGKTDLAEFINVINQADADLLFATAFKLPEDILDALLGTANDSVLRYGIQNSASRISGFHADRTAEFTATALLPKGIEGWVKEGLKGQRGNLLVHTKAVVVNFTSDNPIIISGSHNLSLPASNGNDENYLIIRGNTDLADRYGLEILRFYEHYRFRYYARELRFNEVRPLTEDDSWAKNYYKKGNLKQLSRLRFAGR